MFWKFFSKKENGDIKEETKRGFEAVKKDMTAITGWIKHLDSEKNLQKTEIDDIKEDLTTIKDELENIKNLISIMNSAKNKQLSKQVFKTPTAVDDKQTAVYAVQTAVQTGVQTPNFDNFSVTERAILWLLLNYEEKLSYDDLAAMTGKEKSTIRGQINTIKAKSEGLIEEVVEKNGKKRVFIPTEMKEKLLKKAKVRVKKTKNSKK